MLSRLTLPLLLLAVLAPWPQALGQTSEKARRLAAAQQPPPRTSSTLACEPGVASSDLEVGGVRARLYNNGGLFWRGGDPTYEVPRGSGNHAVFAAGLWVGATVDGELRFAGADYSDWEFWPGPLDENGDAPADCAPYDRIWTVTVQQDGSLTGDVEDWPADLGAPFEDVDGDGTYEPEAGDSPTVYGHQTAFWVMNDRGGEHAWSSAQPLGIEVRVTAFAVDSDAPAYGFATFYRYEIVYKGTEPLENLRVGMWTDADVGNFNDDYVGSDPERGLSFAYNADNNDEGGYGVPPPALGVDLLSGSRGMMYYSNDSSIQGNPVDGADAYRYLNFTWRDGTPLTAWGTGYNPGSDYEPTTWYFPGAPEAAAFWSEFNADGAGTGNPAGDRRFVAVADPVDLEPGGSTTVDVAFLLGLGSNHRFSVGALRDASDAVQAAYDDGSLFEPFAPRSGPPAFEPPDREALPGQPSLLEPEDGYDFNTGPPLQEGLGRFSWTSVAGASYYVLELADDSAFEDPETYVVFGTETELPVGTFNSVETRYWRVAGSDDERQTAYAPPRSFTTLLTYSPGFEDEGAGIVEVAGPVDPCGADAASTGGCDVYGGNSVWHSLNSTAAYYVSANGSGAIDRLERYAAAAVPEDYEMRFTGEENWGVDGFTTGNVVKVPFELWNIGETPDDPSDDVQMIPFVLSNSDDDSPIVDWFEAANVYPGEDPTFAFAASDVIYFMQPDRPNGYELFAEVAAETGAGNAYPFGADGDDLDEGSPTGEACTNNGLGGFVDFCYRADRLEVASDFVYPIGRLLLADYAGDGTPPEAGTVIRLLTTDPISLNGRDDAPSQPALRLDAFPNPVADAATIRFALPTAGPARVAVYDVMGRRVAVLTDGVRAAGTHSVTMATDRLASGLYVVEVRTESSRSTRKVLVVR